MYRLLILFLCVGLSGKCCALGELDIETAWQRVIGNSPILEAAASEIEMREGAKCQASLRPNPLFIVEADNLGVSRRARGAEPPQTTYALSQLVELGGKRCARYSLAASETWAACLKSGITYYDLRRDFVEAFVTVAFAQEKLRLIQHRQRIAASVLEALQCQLNNQKISPLKIKQGELDYRAVYLELTEAEADLALAQNKLATFWGSCCPDFSQVVFDLYCCPSPPCFAEIACCMDQTVDFAFVENQIVLARKDLNLQRSCRMPDVNVTVGYRTFSDSHARGWVIGAEMPIPCLNWNQGNIRRASAGVCQAEYLLEEWVREWNEKMSLICGELATGYNTSEIIREGLLLEAREALSLTEKGYLLGKIDYFEFLGAQSILCDVEEQYLDCLYDYHLNRAELERLTNYDH